VIHGLDASSVQGLLDVNALDAAGCRFLIHKCMQGNDGKDPFFERNIAAAKAKGWRVGAYHFLYPLPHLDPRKQAEGFFAASTLGAADGELPPALDLEWPDPDSGFVHWGCSPQQVSDWSKACAERVTELFGRRPLIYTYPYFMTKLRAAAVSWLAEYPLWIASYGTPKPALPAPWKDWAVWQYDGDKGERMPSGGDADFDRFNGDDAALEAFCRLAKDDGPTAEEREPGAIIHPLPGDA
jgi:lysozyme